MGYVKRYEDGRISEFRRNTSSQDEFEKIDNDSDEVLEFLSGQSREEYNVDPIEKLAMFLQSNPDVKALIDG